MQLDERRVIELTTPEISISEVLAGIGMPSNPDQVSPAIVSMVSEAIENIKAELIKPRSMIQAVAVKPLDANTAELGGCEAVKCPSRAFEGADGSVLVLTTVGPHCDAEMAKLLDEGDALGAMIISAVGTAAVGKAAAITKSIVDEELNEKGYKVGYSLQPGCDEIDLEIQKAIFNLMDPATIELSLNESLIMVPKKSVSSITPYGKKLANPSDGGSACCLCQKHGGCPHEW